MTNRKIQMLFFPRETFPTDRVRLTTLFGRELLGRGHAIDLVMQAANSRTPAGRFEWSGRTVWVGPTDDRPGIYGRTRRILLGLAHDLHWLLRATRREYESILVSDKYVLASLACVVARLRGMKFFFWLTFPYHEAHITLGRERGTPHRHLVLLRGFITRFLLHAWILPRSDHFFVQSRRMLDGFAEAGIDPARMTPIVTGIDLDGVEPRSYVQQIMADRPVTIGYLGTLVPERRLEILIDMLAELHRHGMNARLLVVGDGARPEHRHALEDRAEILGLSSRLEITGLLPRREALLRIRSADICVSPFYPSSVLDVASPTKLIEYLALGIPSVANRHPDQTAVLRESKAGVCVPWNPNHFARAVRWLSRRKHSDLAAMSARGRSWVAARRSYAGIASIFEDAYTRATSDRPA